MNDFSDSLIPQDELDRVFSEMLGRGNYIKLKDSCVAVAGLGGLGSVVATSLARAGVGTLVIADFDKVELGNLNRQHYFMDDIGDFKTQVIARHLKQINPYIKIIAHTTKLCPGQVVELFADVDVIAECFDCARAKQMIVETVLAKLPRKLIVSASGLAGFGNSNVITTKKINSKLILVGDDQTAVTSEQGLYAARVGIAANHQANAIIDHLINNKETVE